MVDGWPTQGGLAQPFCPSLMWLPHPSRFSKGGLNILYAAGFPRTVITARCRSLTNTGPRSL